MFNNLHSLFINGAGVFSFGSAYLPAAAGEAVRYGQDMRPLHDVLSANLVSIMLVIAGAILIVLSLILLVIISRWRVYQKAKQPGWASIVPVYSSIKMLEMTSRPLWWIVLLFVPILNVVLGITLVYRLARNFGRGGWFTLGLVCLPFIFYPILAFGDATFKQTFAKAPAMNEPTKWTLIGLAFWGLTMVIFSSTGNSSVTRPMPLSIIAAPYATDGTYVYAYDQVIPTADPLSFVVLDNDYAKDAGYVYFDGKVLDQAEDPGSFHLLDSIYASDGTHVYNQGELISSDAASFVLLMPDSGYGKDAHAVYYDGYAIPGADIKTFKIESGTIGKDISYDAKDAKHYYSSGEVVK